MTQDQSIRIKCVYCGQSFLAIRRSRKTCSDVCRQNLSRGLRATTPPLPRGKFDLLVADPAWRFNTYSDKGQGRSPSQHYDTMDFDSICRLPIRNIAARDSALVLWLYGPLANRRDELLRRWGFMYNSDLFTWVKTNKSGKPTMGLGYTTRKSSEQAILAIRGRGLTVVNHSVPQVIMAPRREHSRKPEESYERLERLVRQGETG